MSGILDNKSRVIDTILTLEGRRQLSQGGVDVSYVTFTDGATFYKADVASGSQDATQRIYFEACQLPQDDITFQADDSGNLTTFRNSDSLALVAGRILDYSYIPVDSSVIGGTSQTVTQTSGSSFVAATQSLLASSFNNLQNLRIIATIDETFDTDGFALGPNPVTFTINNNVPLSDPNQFIANLTQMDSIFSDPRFSHLPNFHYLPPCNKVPKGAQSNSQTLDKGDPVAMATYFLGQYPPLGRTQADGLTYEQIMSELSYYEQLGCMRQISFDPTSNSNRLIGQFFEMNASNIVKLDVINTGVHMTGDSNKSTSQIFFVGKVEIDDFGTDTFLHLFTLVFE